MLEKRLSYFLRDQRIVSLGTANLKGIPHVSPKILLKYNGKYLYLIDHLGGSSCKNIKENKNVSVSAFAFDKAQGFHIYGKVNVFRDDKEYKSLLGEWDKRQSSMIARSISENVGGKKNIRSRTLSFVRPVEIYKIQIRRIDFINIEGVLAVKDVQQKSFGSNDYVCGDESEDR